MDNFHKFLYSLRLQARLFPATKSKASKQSKAEKKV